MSLQTNGCIKVGVKIMPREVILDTQGRAVETSLTDLNIKTQNVRVGKWIELEFFTQDEKQALEQAHEAAKKLLYNPLIESYSLQIINDQQKLVGNV